MKRIALALLAAAAVACSVSPTAPEVTLEYDPVRSYDWVTIRWMPPRAGDLTGYAIERRIVPDAFEPIETAPVAQSTLSHTIPPEIAELADLEFRVRALPDRDGARVSAAIPLHRGLRPPGVTCVGCNAWLPCACEAANGAIPLAVTNLSRAADGLVLERTVTRAPGAAPARSSIPLPALSQTYRDVEGASAWVDGAQLEYRLVAVKGAERSGAAGWAMHAAAPLPARVLSTALDAAGGLEVTFTNESRSAETFTLVRRDWGAASGSEPSFLASVRAPATGATAVLGVASASRLQSAYYAVRAWLPSAWGSASGDAWFVWPPPATDLLVSVALVRPGNAAVLLEGGAFATAGLARGSSIHLHAPAGAVHVNEDAWLAEPGLALDPLRLPHAVYAVGPLQPSRLVHAWYDGEAWQSEDVGAISSDGAAQVSFDVAPDGTVLACWRSLTALGVARRSSHGWSIESVPLQGVPNARPLVAGDASGGVHVFVSSWTGAVHLLRDPGGRWTSEPVPSVAGATALLAHARGLALVGADAGAAWILERTAAGWGAVETLGAIGPWSFVRAARSLDGERLAIGATQELWLRDAAGTTAHTWTDAGSSFSLGFGPAGKAWVLSGLGAWPYGTKNPAALYEEP